MTPLESFFRLLQVALHTHENLKHALALFFPLHPIRTQADIREYTGHLLRLDEQDPPPLTSAAQRDVQLFAAKKHEGPKASRGAFLLDLEGSCSSPWNKRAGIVFARAFVSSDREYQCKDEKLVAEKFMVHLRTVKKHFEDDSDAEERDPLVARSNRQRTVRILFTLKTCADERIVVVS